MIVVVVLILYLHLLLLAHAHQVLIPALDAALSFQEILLWLKPVLFLRHKERVAVLHYTY